MDTQADLVTVGGLDARPQVIGGLDSVHLGFNFPVSLPRPANPFAEAGAIIQETRTAARIGLGIVLVGLAAVLAGTAYNAWRPNR